MQPFWWWDPFGDAEPSSTGKETTIPYFWHDNIQFYLRSMEAGNP